MRKVFTLFFLILLLWGISACSTEPTGSPIGNTPSAGVQTTPDATVTPTATPDKVTQVDNIFTVSQKKYKYQNKDVMILNLENTTTTAYDVTVTGHFFNAEGDEIATITKEFYGFDGEWSTYAIFTPQKVFSGFEFEFDATEFAGTCYVKCVKPDDGNCFDLSVAAKDSPGINLYKFHKLKKERLDEAKSINMTRVLWVECDKKIDFMMQVVVFDENGQIYYICEDNLYENWGSHDKSLWGNEASDPFQAQIFRVEDGRNNIIDVKADVEKLDGGYSISSLRYAVLTGEEP